MQIAALLLILAATPAGMTPVPAAQLNGLTFTSPDGWFSIAAPGEKWEWLEGTKINAGADPRNPPPEGVTWMARSPHMEDWFVMVESASTTDNTLDDDYIAGFEKKFSAIYERDGATMSNLVMERINLPLAGSLHFTFTTTAKTGTVTYHFGYVTGRGHRVMLLTSSESRVEPKRLKRAIVSLRWLKEP